LEVAVAAVLMGGLGGKSPWSSGGYRRTREVPAEYAELRIAA
jgi:hypothetical protein